MAVFHFVYDDGQIALHVTLLHRAPVSAADETAEQPLSVLLRLARNHVDWAVLRAHHVALAADALRAPLLTARQNRKSNLALGVFSQRQSAEQCVVASGGRFVEKRALDFHPAEGNGWLAVALCQWIAGGPWPITEKASRVGNQ